ncbi:hypothetical protein [Spirosoma endophyticum]|uniref:Adenylate and Guanylate cyclase catalytic domain-containing protein n=1 Tax=Spirosoma endophyticum TaxID=662367 RepID=A0A1I2BAP9_9BACT|nr:hypothetical protein [Spirosoma endophyticum]SFE52220.1 hypothetical protein SAMN05216167_11518 [Spirosoma endophyticum]
MRLYSNYLDAISQAVHSPTLMKGHDLQVLSTLAEARSTHRIIDPKAYATTASLEPATSMKTLADLLKRPVKLPVSGDHPDFIHLRATNGVEYHHITSMFMDVKNSTNFFKKYTTEQIRVIIQVIVTAATHTCALFDGHIQRMQYDGVFAYFGGRGVSREEGVRNAIQAASFFSYFVKYELPEVFEAMDIDDINARTGIDFGDDDDTLWCIYGTGNCTELTTTSLHTSLAPKMQHNAKTNGIMVGANVRDTAKLNPEFYDLTRDKIGNVDVNERYIFKDPDKKFFYTQYHFDWKKYLKETFHFVQTDSNGKLSIGYTPNLSEQERQRRQQLSDANRKIESGNYGYDKKFNVVPAGIQAPRERDFYDTRRD